MNRDVVLVAGHGEMGGGEVMLLACADACAGLGLRPVVVAPSEPSAVAGAAVAGGHAVRTYPAPATGTWWRSIFALRRAVSTAVRGKAGTLVWCHGLRPAAATMGLRGRLVHVHRVPPSVQSAVLRMATAGARTVLVPSQSARRLLPGRLNHRARVLGNWTGDLPPAAVPRSLRRPVSGPPVVGFLGRIAAEKGVADLVDAFEALDGLGIAPRPLLRVGGVPRFVAPEEAAGLHAVLARLGDRVEHPGWVRREEFLADVDVLVCPSRVPEAFGLVVAEAMAACVPVVVSDAGALPEIVGPEHPYVCRAGDPVSLASVLHRALGELGTEAGDSAVARARCRWETLWSPTAGHERVAALLTDLGVLP